MFSLLRYCFSTRLCELRDLRSCGLSSGRTVMFLEARDALRSLVALLLLLVVLLLALALALLPPLGGGAVANDFLARLRRGFLSVPGFLSGSGGRCCCCCCCCQPIVLSYMAGLESRKLVSGVPAVIP
jgi:hypothetical protein